MLIPIDVHTNFLLPLNVAFTCELWNWTVKLVYDWCDSELKERTKKLFKKKKKKKKFFNSDMSLRKYQTNLSLTVTPLSF